MTPVEQALIDRIPPDITELVGRFIGDNNTDLQEVQDLMPASPVVSVIGNHLGISPQPSENEVDQAKAWIDEQIGWQDRAMEVQRKLAEKKPFGEEQALKGEIPLWMNEKWAQLLLFQWSEGLRNAVLEAEQYMEEAL
jgi:hypothetical protein